MDSSSHFWAQGYHQDSLQAHTTDLRPRTVNIDNCTLPLPVKGFAFYSEEKPLPNGLVPHVIHENEHWSRQAVPGLMLSSSDPDVHSWHSSILEDDRTSLSTDSSSPSHARSHSWSQPGRMGGAFSDYPTDSISTEFREPPSPPETSSYFRHFDVIDPCLTLHSQQDCKQPEVKFEMPSPSIYLPLEYEPECFSPDAQGEIHLDYPPYAVHQLQTMVFPTNNEWARTAAVTRSQKQNDPSMQSSNSSSRSTSSGAGSSKASKNQKALSPTHSSRVKKRVDSPSSGEDVPSRPNGRPTKYKKRYSHFQCNVDGCTSLQTFKNKSELKKHIETQHTKPYVCIFGFMDCNYKFGARNEWKRHIQTIHLALSTYQCDHAKCKDKPKCKTEFSRTDLFMKHLERMHSPKDIASRNVNDPEYIAWREETKQIRQRCLKPGPAPQTMTCGYCHQVFSNGDKTWIDLIDHVGLHYQNDDPETRRPWQDDEKFIAWMRENCLYVDKHTKMEIDDETLDSLKDRSSSYASSESSSARQIKLEEADA